MKTIKCPECERWIDHRGWGVHTRRMHPERADLLRKQLMDGDLETQTFGAGKKKRAKKKQASSRRIRCKVCDKLFHSRGMRHHMATHESQETPAPQRVIVPKQEGPLPTDDLQVAIKKLVAQEVEAQVLRVIEVVLDSLGK